MAEITKSELDLARIRASQEDAKRIIAALDADGTLTVVDDPEPEQNEEGEVITAAPSDYVQISVENEGEEEEDEE